MGKRESWLWVVLDGLDAICVRGWTAAREEKARLRAQYPMSRVTVRVDA